MNTQIFRKVSLERLSSPEQLDQTLNIASAREWVALLALGLLLMAALLWGIKGTVVTTATGNGVIVRSGGVVNAVSQQGGVVRQVAVKAGDRLSAGQVVAVVAQPIMEERVKSIQESLSEAIHDRDQQLETHAHAAKLQIAAIARQRTSALKQIDELEDQHRLVNQQIQVEEQLQEKGLVTRQHVLEYKQKAIAIEDQIASLRDQISHLDAQEYATSTQPMESDLTMRLRVSNLQQDLAEASKELELAEHVTTPYSGQVLEVKVNAGSTVANSEPILSIQPDVANLELICYVPALQSKNIRDGMAVQVSPSNIKREEYGFMEGKVTYVADYPATPAALMKNFQNQSLLEALAGKGPVTEVRVMLNADPHTVSGFHWSTSRGPSVSITGGTLCDVQVVTARERPIRLLFPFIKQELGIG